MFSKMASLLIIALQRKTYILDESYVCLMIGIICCNLLKNGNVASNNTFVCMFVCSNNTMISNIFILWCSVSLESFCFVTTFSAYIEKGTAKSFSVKGNFKN